jgi:hypothetical protein
VLAKVTVAVFEAAERSPAGSKATTWYAYVEPEVSAVSL